MALLTCVDCGRAVSDLAASCPGCGRPATHLQPPASHVPITPFGAGSVTPAPVIAPPRSAVPAVAAKKPPEQVMGEWLRRTARKHPAPFVFGGLALAGILVILVALNSRANARAKAERDQRDQEAAAALASANAETERQNARIRADKAKEDAEKARARQTDIARIKSQSSTMARAQRDEWIRQCVERGSAGGCDQWQVDAMIAGVAIDAERLRAERVSFAVAAERTARENAKDGSEMSSIPTAMIAGLVARPNLGLPMLELVRGTSLAEAKKDPDAARGKRIRVGGNIVEIRSSGGGAEGALMTDGMTVVRFYTGMATDGIYDGAWATFVGVFIQEYDYANVSGGQTRSYLLSGAFDIPANHAAQ